MLLVDIPEGLLWADRKTLQGLPVKIQEEDRTVRPSRSEFYLQPKEAPWLLDWQIAQELLKFQFHGQSLLLSQSHQLHPNAVSSLI